MAWIKGMAENPFEGIVEPMPEFIHFTGLAFAAVQVPKSQLTIPAHVSNIWDHPIKVWTCQNHQQLLQSSKSWNLGKKQLITLFQMFNQVVVYHSKNS